MTQRFGRGFFLTLLFSLALIGTYSSDGFAIDPAPAGRLKVLRVTPAGEEVDVHSQQVVFEFDQPVVPLGEMARAADTIPIKITPALNCEWRWLNPTTLSCQLKDADEFRYATRYEIVVSPGIKTEAGTTTSTSENFAFITKLPMVSRTYVESWPTADKPQLRVYTTQPVDTDSLIGKLSFRIASSGELVPAKLIKANVKRPKHEGEINVLANSASISDGVVGVDTGESNGVQSEENQSEEDGEESDEPATSNELKYKDMVFRVEPNEPLAEGQVVELVLAAGLLSTQGPLLGKEQAGLLQFTTPPPFKFLGIKCDDPESNGQISISQSPIAAPDPASCHPLHGATMLFTSPVDLEELKAHLRVTPDLTGGLKDFNPWEYMYASPFYSGTGSPATVTLPRYLRARALYTLRAEKGVMKDRFGRPLVEPIEFAFHTAARPTKFYVDGRMSVLESKAKTKLPVFVTNIDALNFEYETLTSSGASVQATRKVPVDNVKDVAYAFPFDVRGLLGENTSGLIKGRISSIPQTMNEWNQKNEEIKQIVAQVTPFFVHVKAGHYNTIVWVTDLQSGKPVKNARVSLQTQWWSKITTMGKEVISGVTDADGIAVFAGREKWDRDTSLVGAYMYESTDKEIALVRVDHDGQMGIVPLTRNARRYETNSSPNGSWIPSYSRDEFGHIRVWGTCPQGVYKLGDKVQFKLFVRNQSLKALVAAPKDGYKLRVTDPKGEDVYVVENFSLNEFGTYDGEFVVPTSGAVGYYQFTVSASFAKALEMDTFQVLVSDFTPAPFRVKTELNGKKFEAGQQLIVSSSAELHSGGPYANAESRVNVSISGAAITLDTTAIPDKKDADLYKNFSFEQADVYDYPNVTVHESTSQVDTLGKLTTTVTLPDDSVTYGPLSAETAVKDDRGKSVASSARGEFFGRDRYVGLRQNDWVITSGKPTFVEVLVIDTNRKPVVDAAAKIIIQREERKGARVQGAGNAYLTNYTTEWVDVASCDVVSAFKPKRCAFTPDKPGDYRITATVNDTKGRVHTSSLRRLATGKGDVLWDSNPDQPLSIIADREEYQVGDTAKFIVKNPYPGAMALITVERYGVIKRWVQDMPTALETVSVAITPDLIPGYFLSVVVMAPRVDKPVTEDQVDLGKPISKVGYVDVTVKDQHKELVIQASSDRQVYKPRDTVQLALHAETRQKKTEPMELAVVVLDEAVFDLIASGADYFDVYKAFYAKGSLDVQNFNLLELLVGRRNFDKKGANSGGSGGDSPDMRSLIKYVSYWNPHLLTDAQGNAKAEFTLPDNLTGWRVLVLGVDKADRMGLGQTTLKVTQDTEIRPALPNQVLAGDDVVANLTVMNRMEKERTLDVSVSISGAGIEGTSAVHEEKIVAKPFERVLVKIPLKPTKPGIVELIASASDALDKDKVKLSFPVRERRVTESASVYGSLVEGSFVQSLKFPPNIRGDAGGVKVVLSPTALSSLEGAFKFLRDYPYSCWEQKLTKGVMASLFLSLRSHLDPLLEWKDAEAVVQDTLDSARKFQTASGAMTYFLPEESYASDYLSAYTALAFNWLRAQGRTIPKDVEEKLHGYLGRMLRDDTFESYYSPAMRSTVRAVALAALASHGKVTREELERYAPSVSMMSLFGKAHFLQAAIAVSGTDAMQATTVNQIRSYANETGGKLILTETLDAVWSRLLVSPLRENCAVLSSFVSYNAKHPESLPELAIPPKLVRYVIESRKGRAHWENTQENMFCMNALLEYAKVFEKDKPDFKVNALLDGASIGSAKFSDFREPPQTFSKAMTPADPGRSASLTIQREGTGRAYYSAHMTYIPVGGFQKEANAGIEVRREYSVERNGKFELLKSPMTVKQGELVRVDLFLVLPAARNYVVVDDPIPGGLEPVNRDLATSSEVDAKKGDVPLAGASFWFTFGDWIDYGVSRWSFYHRELRHDSVRFYSEYLVPGHYHLSYVAQAIAPGRFQVEALKAEEMYDPEVFGRSTEAELAVDAK